jgi:hypothetical protein
MYVHFTGNVTRVGYEVSDVTSVNTELQQSNLVSACSDTVDSTEETGHFTLWTIYQGAPHLHYVSERRGLVVNKLDCQAYNWRPTEVLSKKNVSVKYILGLTIHQEVTATLYEQQQCVWKMVIFKSKIAAKKLIIIFKRAWY